MCSLLLVLLLLVLLLLVLLLLVLLLMVLCRCDIAFVYIVLSIKSQVAYVTVKFICQTLPLQTMRQRLYV